MLNNAEYMLYELRKNDEFLTVLFFILLAKFFMSFR